MMPRKMIDSPLALIENLAGFRNNRRLGFVATDLLAKFYPDMELATRDIHRGNTPYKTMSYLAQKNHLEKIDNCHMAPRYRLTFQGKCIVLCKNLGIRFLTLCILAGAYEMHKLQAQNGCLPSYSLFETDRIFERIYSKKTVRNSAYMLFSKNMAYSRSSNLITLKDDAFKSIGRHDRILGEIHDWMIGVPGHLDRLAIEDPKMYARITGSGR